MAMILVLPLPELWSCAHVVQFAAQTYGSTATLSLTVKYPNEVWRDWAILLRARGYLRDGRLV